MRFYLNVQKLFRTVMLLAFALVGSFDAQAKGSKIKVMKAKGRRAIVQFPTAAPPVGTTLQVLSSHGDEEGEESEETDEDSDAEGSRRSGYRDYYIGLGSNFTKTMAEGSSATFSVNGSFGWNFEDFELGPFLSFTKSSGDPSFGAGLAFDWNFAINNKDPNIFVPGLVLKGNFGAGAATSFGGQVGLFMKLFVLRQSATAIRADFLFDISKTSGLDPSKSIQLVLGLQTYF